MLAVALCVASLSRAQTYFIDDTNSTIQYNPGGRQVASGSSPSQWHIAQQPEVNLTKSYNETSTGKLVGECNTSQNCSMVIPFQGSGITLYIVQVNFSAVNVSITVDNLQPEYQVYPEAGYLHNVTLFNVQGLPFGPHTISVGLLDYAYTSRDAYAYKNGTSTLVFDFAVVNEASASITPGPSTAAPAPTQKSSSSTSKSPLGAIIGGAVGVVALITAAIIVYLCRHRIAASSLRRRRTEIDPEPTSARRSMLQTHGPSPPTSPGYVSSGFDAAGLYQPHSQPPFTNSQPPFNSSQPIFNNSQSPFNNAQPPYPPTAPPGTGEMSEVGYAPSSSGGGSSGRERRGYGSGSGLTPATELAYARFSDRSSMYSGGSGVQGQPLSAAPLGLHSAGMPSPSRSSASPSIVSRALSDIPSIDPARASQLTPEQLDFVSNLISLNVPAADIAGVMERMREEGAEGESSRRTGAASVERVLEGRGDEKAPPTDEELPQYEPRQ
ncbi:hypothetical protein HWV62_23348 [Athelia sp. TMB]|nr:hypothetical protein HWV62_23348 [Athelia sp. TMB]